MEYDFIGQLLRRACSGVWLMRPVTKPTPPSAPDSVKKPLLRMKLCASLVWILSSLIASFYWKSEPGLI